MSHPQGSFLFSFVFPLSYLYLGAYYLFLSFVSFSLVSLSCSPVLLFPFFFFLFPFSVGAGSDPLWGIAQVLLTITTISQVGFADIPSIARWIGLRAPARRSCGGWWLVFFSPSVSGVPWHYLD